MFSTKEAIGILRPNAHRICDIITKRHAQLNDVGNELPEGWRAVCIRIPEWYEEPTEAFDCGL